MPLIPESDAARIAQSLSSAAPEDRPWMLETLTRYQDQQQEFGLPEWPSQVQAQQAERDRINGMFTGGIDKVPFEVSPWSKDPSADKATAANIAFLSSRYGKPPQEIADRHDFFRDDYARQHFGQPGGVDDKAFYGLAAKEVTKQVDDQTRLQIAQQMGMQAALEGKATLESLAQNAMDSPDTEVSNKAFFATHRAVSDVLAKHRPLIATIADTVERSMTGTAQEGDAEKLAAASEQLLNLPGSERRLVFGALRAQAEARGKVNADAKEGGRGPMDQGKYMAAFIQQIGESAGRFGENALTDNAAVQTALNNTPETGEVRFSGKAITTPEEARQYVSEQISKMWSDKVAAQSPTPEATSLGNDGKNTITLDDKAASLIRDAKARMEKRMRVQNELRQIGNATDPIPNIFASTLGSSGAIMGVMAASRGMAAPAIMSAYSNTEYNDLSAKYPQMSHADKQMVSGISAAAQTALDYVGVKAFSGLHVGKLLANPEGLTKMLVARGLGNAVLSYGVENVVEGAQDIATPALIQALKLDVPGFDWEKEKAEFWKGRSDVAIGMLPLTLIGLGAASVNDYGNGKALLASNLELGRMGLPEQSRVATLEAAQAGDMEKAQTLFREGFAKRDPAIAAEFQTQADERQQEQQAASNELTRIGLLPDIQRDSNGYTVSADGQTAKFKTWDEARAVATQHMNENERNQADLVAHMADSFISGTPATLKGESFDIRQGSTSLADRVRTGQMTAEDAMESAVAGGVIKGLTIPEARTIASGVFGDSQEERTMAIRREVERIPMLGSNRVQNGQSQSTVDLGSSIKGGNERAFLTVVEEAVEGRWKAGLAAKSFTKEQGLSWVRLAEQATGERFLEGMTHDEVASSKEVSPRALTEAISRIVTADVLGRLKDGKRIGPGAVSRGLNLADREQSALAAILNAFRQFFAAILHTAAKLAKARKEGKLGSEYDQLFDKLTGDGTRWEHEQGAVKEANAIAHDAAGETFSLGKREKLDLSDAMDRVTAFYEDEADTDNWPEDVQEALAESPMQQGIDNNDFAEFYSGMPESERTPQREQWNADTKRAEAGEEVDLEKAEAFLESDKARKMAITPFLPQVIERVKEAITQIEATGRFRWSAKAKEFVEQDEPIISYSLRSGDFQARVDKVYSDFAKTPEKRLTLVQVARQRVQQELDKLRAVLDERAAGEQQMAEGEIRHAEAVAKLRDDLEADEAQIRQDRDFELAAVTQDKGTELDRERIRREADNALKKRRVQFERELAAVDERLASGELKGAKTGAGIDRQKIKAIMRVMEAAVSTLPMEIRGKIGNFSQIATMSDEKALDVVEAKIRKADAEFEKYLKKELSAQVDKLLARGKPKTEAGKKAKGKDADMHALFAAAEAAQSMDADTAAGELARLDVLLASDSITPEQETLLTTQRGLVELFGDWKHADAARMEAALETLRYIHTDRWLKWKLAEIERKERRAGLRHAFITDTGKSGVKTERDAADRWAASFLGKIKDKALSLSSFSEVLSYAFGQNNDRVNALVDAERNAAGQNEDANQRLADEVQSLFTAMAGGSVIGGEQLHWQMTRRDIKTAKGELSQLEAIQALLMWAQEDGQRHMEGTRNEAGDITSKWHYDQAWIDEVESKLTPEARRVMAWIKGKYAGEYATLNPLYRQRYGVDMAGHKDYAPITVTPMQTKGGEVVDPVTGQAVSGGSVLNPGSLRTRSRNAVAEPEFRDALQTFMLHSRQLEYWKAYYDLASEMSSIMGNREVMNAVHAKGGKEAANALRQWVDAIAQGGFNDASMRLDLMRGLSRIQGRAAGVALLGRMSAILSQSTQLAAAAVQMPMTSYISRLAKLTMSPKGWNGWAAAIKSDFIQRRFKSAPPIVKQAMDSLAAAKPGQIQRLTRFFGNVLSGADAFFTSGTYAILLDYHLAQGAKMGLSGAELDSYAHTEAERATEQVAQPTRLANRSLAELTTTNPLAKLGWAFASEARQKVALAWWAGAIISTDPARTAKAAALTFLVGGLFTQILKNLLREAKGDDDDMWSPGRLLYSATLAPLVSAVPFGSAIAGDSNTLSGVKRAFNSLNDGEVDWRDVDSILSAAGILSPWGADTFAALAQASHLAQDAGKIIQNLAD